MKEEPRMTVQPILLTMILLTRKKRRNNLIFNKMKLNYQKTQVIEEVSLIKMLTQIKLENL